MKSLKKWQTNWISILTIIITCALILLSLRIIVDNRKYRDTTVESVVKIGAGDDISGLVLSFMKDEMRNQLGFELQPYFIRDC